MPDGYKVCRRGGSNNYFVRFYVPARYRKALGGKNEIWRTLGTPDKRYANERAVKVASEILDQILAVQSYGPPAAQAVSEPSHQQLEEASREVYEIEVLADIEERAHHDPETVREMGFGTERRAEVLRAEAKRLRMAVASGDFRVANIEYWQEHFGFEFVPGSVKEMTFKQLLANVYAKATKQWAKHERGKFDLLSSYGDSSKREGEITPYAGRQRLSASAAANDIEPSLIELWDAHVKGWGGGVKAGTLSDRQISVELFASYIGHHVSASDVTKSAARSWIQALYKFPNRAAQRKEFQGKSFTDIIALNAELGFPVINQRTIAKHISALNTYFDWLVREERVERNVFDGLLPRIRRTGKTRAQLSDSQLATLFSSPLFVGCDNTRDITGFTTPGELLVGGWRYWMPLISAYSGARLGEIAQLRCQDVGVDSGIAFFDIVADDSDGLSTKSAWSNRLVPIHSELLGLGLLDYVKGQKLNGEKRLFPELRRDANGQFGAVSKWFGKYLRKMPFTPDLRGNLPSFHSFRHAAINRMSKTMGDHEIQPLVGHEATTTTKGYRETASYGLERRQEFIERIQYPGVELEQRTRTVA